MAVKEKNENKKKIEKRILIKFDPETKKVLEKNKIPFTIEEITSLPEDKEEITKEFSLISINEELYQKLKQLSEITGISLGDIANSELEHFLNDFVSENPYYFLDIFLGIENVKDPLSVVYQMKSIVNISEDQIKELENVKDPKAYVKSLYGFKSIKDN